MGRSHDETQVLHMRTDRSSDGWFIMLDYAKPPCRGSKRTLCEVDQVDREAINAKKTRDTEKLLFKEKIKLTFMKADEDGDGWLTESEFIAMVTTKLSTNQETAQKIFKKIAGDSFRISFDQFYSHYDPYVKRKCEETESSSGDLHKEKKKFVSAVRIIQNQLRDQKSPGLLKLLERSKSLLKAQIDNVENGFAQLFTSEDANDIEKYIMSRWDAFVNFKRKGKDGKVVMTSEEEITDALPGSYDILNLVMDQFDTTIMQCKPKFLKLKPVKWIPSEGKGKHGKLLCPGDCTIPVEIGTNQNLSYYGACFATELQRKVALLHRHATVNFVYSTNYHQDYVMQDSADGKGAGGCGLETHAFHHMDCPLEDESGYFLLGKLINTDELHITAFKIPRHHVLYVPPNVIHSNDYMVGKWRTMLADNVDIDHVHFMKETKRTFAYEHAHVEISG